MKKLLLILFLFLLFFLAKGQCPTITPQTYTIGQTAPGEIYWPNGNSLWEPGDTLEISEIPGGYFVVQFGNLKGDSCHPIVIRNKSGQVRTATIRLKNDCRYIRVVGNNDNAVEYGFYCQGGPFNIETSKELEVAYVEVANSNIGLFVRCVPDTSDPRTWYGNYELTNLNFHHFYIHDVSGEAVYAGSTSGNGNTYSGVFKIPVRLRNVSIKYFKIVNAGWDGIQLATTKGYNEISNCEVINYGTANIGSQQAGIIGGAQSDTIVVKNCRIIKGTGNGIQGFSDVFYVLNSYLDTCGTSTGQQSIITNNIPNTVEPQPDQKVTIKYDSIYNINPGAAIIQCFDGGGIMDFAKIDTNFYCIPSAPIIINSPYIVVNSAYNVEIIRNINQCKVLTVDTTSDYSYVSIDRSPEAYSMQNAVRYSSFNRLYKLDITVYNMSGQLMLKKTDRILGDYIFELPKRMPVGVYIVTSMFYGPNGKTIFLSTKTSKSL